MGEEGRRSGTLQERTPAVFILILNWNGWPDTVECLESVLRLNYPTFTVGVCDNGSTDGSLEYIIAWAEGRLDVHVPSNHPLRDFSFPPIPKPIRFVLYDRFQADHGRAPSDAEARLILISTGANLGFAGGNNVGLRYAIARRYDYVFILNNDTVVQHDALAEMIRNVAGKPEIGMVAPAVYDYTQKDVVDRMGLALTKAGLAYERVSGNDGVLFCPSGCAALYSRSLLLAAESGGHYFDEDFFAYYEDIDLGFRAQRKGFKALLAEGAIIYHKGGATSGGRGSLLSVYFGHRNAIWSVVKNFSTRMLVTESPWIILGNVLELLGNVYRPEFRSVVKGKWHGLVGAPRAWLKRREEAMPGQGNVNLSIDGKRLPFRRGPRRRSGGMN